MNGGRHRLVGRIGRLAVAAGVLVWAVFAAAWLAGARPDPGAFLPFHLAGVTSGAVMSRVGRRAGTTAGRVEAGRRH